MTTEEKAKAYDEAIKRAKELVSKENVEAAEYIFPELAESEDERIREELIDYVDISILSIDERHDRWIAWLEKQGEQKTEDKPEYKFKVGDTMRMLQEATDNITSGLPVVISIDKEYYHCNNELIAIKDQDDYEYPPMNRIQKPVGVCV